MTHILLPLISRMGIMANYEVLQHGMSPDVIGEVKLTVESLGDQKLRPLILKERGTKMKIILHVKATDGEFTDFYKEIFSKAMNLKIK